MCPAISGHLQMLKIILAQKDIMAQGQNFRHNNQKEQKFSSALFGFAKLFSNPAYANTWVKILTELLN